MPLKDTSLQTKRPTNSFEQQPQWRADTDAVDRSGTPSNPQEKSRPRSESSTSDSSISINPLRARDVIVAQDDRRHALDMKIAPPTTLSSRIRDKFGYLEVSSRAAVTSELLQKTHVDPRDVAPSTIDHTNSFNFDDASFQDNESRTVVFRGTMDKQLDDYSVRGLASGRRPHEQVKEEARLFQSMATQIPDDWQDTVMLEKEMQAQEHARLSAGREDGKSLKHHDAYLIGETDEPVEDMDRTAKNTPPRTRAVESAQVARTSAGRKLVMFDSPGFRSKDLARADSPELETARSHTHPDLKSTTKGTKHGSARTSRAANPENDAMTYIPAIRTSSKSRLNQQTASWPYPKPRSVNTSDPSRESDCPTSEDERAPSQAEPPVTEPRSSSVDRQRKRSQEGTLDHDVGSLESMTFQDLCNEEFIRDPRDTGQHATYDVQGHPMSLSQRLQNLDKMSHDEQRRMFRCQSDGEWSQVGSWFIDKFQEHLDRIVEIRAERRKISLRFEDEVRRRQKDVDNSIAGIDQELKILKKGGGDLIKGRSTPSRQGTPRKG